MTNLQEKAQKTIKCRLTIGDARKNPDALLDSSGQLERHYASRINLQEKAQKTIKCRLTIGDARKNPDAVLDSSGKRRVTPARLPPFRKPDTQIGVSVWTGRSPA
jgi:hypothetical protein